MAAHQSTVPAPLAHSYPPDPYADDPLSWTWVVFRHVPDFPGYGVDTLGNVWSLWTRTGGKPPVSWRIGTRWVRKVATPGGKGDDHLRVRLVGVGGRRSFRVHNLVARVFLGPPSVGREACHRNGNPTDNRIGNIYWGTRQQNMDDRERHGRTAKGERGGGAKLTRRAAADVLARSAAGESARSIGRSLGVHHSTITAILRGESWTVLAGEGRA